LGRCVVHQLARFIFLTIDTPLLKHTIDYANLVVERMPEVLQTTRILQIEAAHKYATIKQDIVDWGIPNGPTLANMHLTQGHLDKQIEVDEDVVIS
jgi:hypothetical protein